jgi:hypothetical protein
VSPLTFAQADRRGSALIWSTFTLVALIAIASLAVDYGGSQMYKSELQRAADGIALHAAGGLASGVASVESRATTAAADNKVGGQTLSFSAAQDLEFGVWDPADRSFEVLSGSERNSATAVRVTLRRTQQTTFAKIIGRSTVDIRATSIASRGSIVAPAVNADGCPWLAGMPNGSSVAPYGGNTTPATAPNNSPLAVTNIPLTAGSKLYFRRTSGSTSYMNAGTFNADGNTGWIVQQNPANGINSTAAPLNSLVGIFLDNRAPNTWSQAASLNFSTGASRDFTTLSPQLKQVFFIGDGMTANNQLQEFVVPAGATRLYLGLMDEKGWWWDNTGTLTTTMMDSRVTLVK